MKQGTTTLPSEPGRTASTQKIVTHLWFDNQAEEAAKFYASIFKNSRITGVSRYGDAAAKAAGRPKGSVMNVTFDLDGQEFMALNGGPVFRFTEAISLVAKCANQKEVDTFCEKLSAGGETSVCGWLKDKYGVSWQVVPSVLFDMMADKDPRKSQRVMQALLKMGKLEIKGLQDAYERR